MLASWIFLKDKTPCVKKIMTTANLSHALKLGAPSSLTWNSVHLMNSTVASVYQKVWSILSCIVRNTTAPSLQSGVMWVSWGPYTTELTRKLQPTSAASCKRLEATPTHLPSRAYCGCGCDHGNTKAWWGLQEQADYALQYQRPVVWCAYTGTER